MQRQHKGIPELHLSHLVTIVQQDRKGRYRLLENNDRWYIACCQGHNIKFKHIAERIGEAVDSSQLRWVIHGTHRKLLDSIMTQGIKSMNRTHIHFTQGVTMEILQELKTHSTLGALRSATVGNESEPIEVVSGGARSSAKVLIIVDCQKAMKDGITFQRAENGVILSEGDEAGRLAPKYFSAVIDIEKGLMK
jgi:2'-phosphotransferase